MIKRFRQIDRQTGQKNLNPSIPKTEVLTNDTLEKRTYNRLPENKTTMSTLRGRTRFYGHTSGSYGPWVHAEALLFTHSCGPFHS